MVVRRWYQRAVVVPTHYLDALYRQYEVFEGAGNKKLSKKVGGWMVREGTGSGA